MDLSDIILIGVFAVNTVCAKSIDYVREYLMEEYSEFVKKIDNFLLKFSTTLPINVIEILTQIKTSNYISFPASELSLKKYFESCNMPHSTALDVGLALEHSDSSLKLPEDEKTVKIYHELLLSLISTIDDYLPQKKIKMFIRLDPEYPEISSAISKFEL